MKILKLFTGILLGYLITSLLVVTLSFVLPFTNKAEATLLATMISYIFWLCLILYSLGQVTFKNLFIQYSFLSIHFYLINYCLILIKE